MEDEIARVTEAIRNAYPTAGYRNGVKRMTSLSKAVCGDLAIAAIAAIRQADARAPTAKGASDAQP
jgi:hypothetical protein